MNKKAIKKLAALTKITIILAILLSGYLTVNTALAETVQSGDYTNFKPSYVPKPETLPGPSTSQQENEGGGLKALTNTLLPRLAIMMIGTVGGVSLIFLIVGAVRFATMYGNDDAIDKAKKQIIYAIVGFLISLLSYTIITTVVNLKFQNNQTKQVETQP
ncbi:hypothetical protein HZC20_02100 [Candidatus Peregrinibacteria bacterium]|nr:hypothetical protein [Candidatus Peregrinibacteria bacterium]